MSKRTQRVKIQGRNGPIEVEFIDAPISAHGGISLLHTGFFKSKMFEEIDLNLSIKERDRGYSETEYIESLVCLLALGGDRLDDLAMLKEDEVIGELIPTPTAKAMGGFIQKMYLPHIRVLKNALAKGVTSAWQAASHEISSLTIDIDSSIVEMAGHQQGVKRCYEGTVGYHPIFAFFAELETPANAALRSGNVHSGSKAVSFLEETKNLYPGLPIKNLRADSAFYNKNIVEFCEEHELGFTITADQTAPLLSAIADIPESSWLRMDDTFETAEFKYQPTGWKKEYRFIVTRKITKRSLFQPSLFTSHDYTYHVFVTNRAGCKTSLVRIHHDRGNCENLIKELKSGFAAENMPSHQFMANHAWLLCSAMAMTLQTYLQRSGLNQSKKFIRSKRFRFKWLHRACRLVCHARKQILQILLPEHQQTAFRFALAQQFG